MIDGWARRRLDPWLTRMARPLARCGAPPNVITILGCFLGLAAALAIAMEAFFAGLVLILFSRLFDGLDGAVARLGNRVTDLGGFLDIVLDFVFYGAIPLAFVIADPAQNGVAGAALLFAFYVNGATFLAFAALAARLGMKGNLRGPKSIHFTTGLAEAGETLIFFIAFCLLPHWFAVLALVFAALCLVTAAARIHQARRQLGRPTTQTGS